MKDKIIEIRKRAEQILLGWNNDMSEHSIEARGMIMVCDELLEHPESKEQSDRRARAEAILKDELSEYYWSVINKSTDVHQTPFKDWIINAMLEFEQPK